jgi:hypothetical protein
VPGHIGQCLALFGTVQQYQTAMSANAYARAMDRTEILKKLII